MSAPEASIGEASDCRPTAGRSSIVFLIIAVVCFFAHFFHLSQFGFYEDDYWATVPFIGQNLSQIPDLLSEAFLKWPQGRPLNHSLPKVQAVLGMHLGGVSGIYAVAYCGFVLNACLVFVIVRRFMLPTAALCAATAYILFPADTTRPFLVHAGHVQGGMTFFLLGSWLWLKEGRWRLIAYPVAALTLTAYETAFLPFLTLPLFSAGGFKEAWRILLKHLAVCAVIVAAFGAFRLTRGESRAVGALHDPFVTLSHIISSLLLGPWTSGSRTLVAPLEGWKLLDPTAVICSCLAGSALVLLMCVNHHRTSGSRAGSRGTHPERKRAIYFVVCSVLTWACSYALTLTNYPPTQTMGRLTSTHTAAAWGVAVLVGALISLIATLPLSRVVRAGCVLLGLFYFAGGLGFDQWVQREYVRSWKLQQAFWEQVVKACPEAGPNWTIIVAGPPSESSKVMFTNSWADILTCRALYSAPVNFAHLGMLHDFVKFRAVDHTVFWTPEFWGGAEVPIDESKLILLSSDGVSLTRIAELETRAGTLHAALAPPPAARLRLSGALAKMLLSPVMIDSATP